MDATRQALDKAALPDVDAVRKYSALVCFTPAMAAQSADLKKFLFHNLYRHPQVLEKMDQAQQVVRDLFAAYMADPSRMPQAHADRFDGTDTPMTASAKPERVVADYIAGMTDRFAAKEHERL
jgi:dGTPase